MAPTNKLSPQDRESLLERIQAGESYVSIARSLGVSVQAVSFHARKVVGPKDPSKISEEESSQIASRFLDGERATDLAREFGVGLTTVRAHIEKQTGSKPGRNRRRRGVNPPVTVGDRAYLAALIDGEGCISSTSSAGHHGWQVTITNTSEELRASIAPLGGRFYFPKRQKSSVRGKGYREPVWVWKTAAAWDVHRLLVSVEPFMRIKREKARRAIAEIETRYGAPPLQIEDRYASAALLLEASLDQARRMLTNVGPLGPPLRAGQLRFGL